MTVTDIHTRHSSSGRIPPHNLQAEASLLGAMLLSKTAIDTAAERLTADDFYKPAHGHVYDAITGLHASGLPADPVTVADELDRAGLLDAIGGPAALLDLQAGTPAISNAARYTTIIESDALLRRMIAVGGEIAELGYSHPAADDTPAAVDTAEALMFNVAQRHATDTVSSLDGLVEEALDLVEQRYEAGVTITGTPTGFTDLDDLTAGLQPGALVGLGARPSAGKTALALNLAAHVALDAHRPVLLFSLEMSKLELTQRLVCAEARVDSKRVRNGNLTEADWGKFGAATARLADAPMWIDDDPTVTVMGIRAKARRLKSRVGDLGLIVVDYLQLMTGRRGAESRQVEVAEMSRGLKILARELNCPVLVLSQLSRGLEMRADKRPMLADLRESGAVEQDCDVVMFIYRDEMYHPDTADRGTAEVIVAKHRNGPTGVVRLAFLDHYTKFVNLSKQGA